MRDLDWARWERLSRAWEELGVGRAVGPAHGPVLPPRSVNATANASGNTSASREASPWRNPGDRHDPHNFEEHTIVSALHAAAVLSRSPPKQRIRSRDLLAHSRERVLSASVTSPLRRPKSASPLKRAVSSSGGRGRAGAGANRGGTAKGPVAKDVSLFAVGDVADLLDNLFERDDADRRRLRRAAVTQVYDLFLSVRICTHALVYVFTFRAVHDLPLRRRGRVLYDACICMCV